MILTLPDGSVELNRQTNEPIVRETRDPKPFRALPRPVLDRIVGNAEKGIVGLETSKKFLVRYQEFVGPSITAIRCWKCGQPICGYQPVLRKIEGARNTQQGELMLVRINGQEMVQAALLPYAHYREGLCTYRTAQQTLAAFSYLHCADCAVTDADAENLLACHLGGHDHLRETLKASVSFSNDDAWAQVMFRWSGVELIGLAGPSKGPAELMDDNGKQGKH